MNFWTLASMLLNVIIGFIFLLSAIILVAVGMYTRSHQLMAEGAIFWIAYYVCIKVWEKLSK